MKYYVYIHYRRDDDTPFYIGKGCGRRAFRLVGRSTYWNRIVAKHGIAIRIINFFKVEADAFQAEKDLIAGLKEKYTLCNFTEGGDGISGFRQSPETIALRMKSYASTRKQRSIPFPPQTGSLNFNFKGPIRATNVVTGQSFIMLGGTSIEAHGFNKAAVYKCANGTRKTYRKHIFERIPNEYTTI